MDLWRVTRGLYADVNSGRIKGIRAVRNCSVQLIGTKSIASALSHYSPGTEVCSTGAIVLIIATVLRI